MLASSIRLAMAGDQGEQMPGGQPKMLQRASTIKTLVVANGMEFADEI